MIKQKVPLVAGSETIGDWEEVRGSWRVDSTLGAIKVYGSQPSSPRFELSKLLTADCVIQTGIQGLDSGGWVSGIKLRIASDGSFIWVRLQEDFLEISYFNGSGYTILIPEIPLDSISVIESPNILTAVNDDTNDHIYVLLDNVLIADVTTDLNKNEARHGLLAADTGQVVFTELGYTDYVDVAQINYDAPTLLIEGSKNLEIRESDGYIEEGAKAYTPEGTEINVVINSNIVDDSISGFYTVEYSTTHNGITVIRTREVTIIPDNYLPEIESFNTLEVAANSSVVITPETSDLDGDEVTFVVSQTAGTSVVIDTSTSGKFSFTAPNVGISEMLSFEVTPFDGTDYGTAKNLEVYVKKAPVLQRTMVAEAQPLKQESTAKIDIPNLAGIQQKRVIIKDWDSESILVDGTREFSEGKVDIPVLNPKGVKYVGLVVDETFPPSKATAVAGATTGEIICYANDCIESRSGILPVGVTKIGEASGSIINYKTENGAILTYEEGKVLYSPNGAFDYLDPGEVAFEVIPYFIGELEYSLTIKILASEQVGPNLAGTTQLNTPYSFVEGETYEIFVETSGVTQGEITPTFEGSNVKAAKYGFSRNGREVWHMKSPQGVANLRLVETGDWDGSLTNLRIREVLQPDVPVEPRKLETHLWKGEQILFPIIEPLYDISEGANNQDLFATGVLDHSDEFGVRSTSESLTTFKVVDFTCTGKRGGVSLKGGDYVICDNGLILGGYPAEQSRFATGLIFADTGDRMMKKAFISNMRIDMLEPSHRGDYAEGSNSDCVVMNSSSLQKGYEMFATTFNCLMRQAGDGIIDTKHLHYGNNLELELGFRTLRSHDKTIHVIANSSFYTADGNQCAFHIKTTFSRNILFNCYYEDELTPKYRIVDNSDFLTDDERVFDADISYSSARDYAMHIAKTLPRLHDSILAAHDTLICQYSPSGQNAWSDLPAIDESHAGAKYWNLSNLPQGHYDFRVASILKKNQSGWTYLQNVEVNYA